MAEPISKSQVRRMSGTWDDMIYKINGAIMDQYPTRKAVVISMHGYSRDQAQDIAKQYEIQGGWKAIVTAFGADLTPLLRLE